MAGQRNEAPRIPIDPSGRLAGYWVELVYAASYFCDPVRPILHFELGNGHVETATLPAPVCGRAIWRGKIPAGATSWLDAGPGVAADQFRVESVTAIGLSSLAFRAARSPRIGLVGVVQHALGMRDGARRKIAATLQDERLDAYDRWRAARVREPDLDGLDRPPSILADTPPLLLSGMGGTPGEWDRTLASLRSQICPAWRLDIQVSSDEERQRLRSHAALGSDPRVTILGEDAQPPEGIVASLTLMPGDCLARESVAVLLHAFLSQPGLAAVSFDEDEPIGPKGRRPILGPCQHHASLPDTVRSAVRWNADGVKPDGGVRHIARVLLHRAKKADATSVVGARRRATRARFEQTRPSVDIVIPTRDRVALLRRCMGAILERTDYPNLQVIVADNDTTDPESVRYLDTLRRMDRVRVIPSPGKFNFAAICNKAAAAGSGQVIVFLNNDVEAKGRHWLDALVQRATTDGIGAVGAKLYYPNGIVQHAGIVLGLHGAAGHIYRGAEQREPGYLRRLATDQIVSAVTGACLAVERRKFEEVGGFDEAYPVEFNDVDLCLRLAQRGHACLWTPAAELIHFESASRGRFILPGRRRHENDRARFQELWAAQVANDPCYHPALSLTLETPRLG